MLIMDVIELRTDLHNMIDKISDSNILNAVKTLLSEKATKQADWWDEISEDERKSIEEGLAEADRGDLIPHEQVMKELKSRYKLD